MINQIKVLEKVWKIGLIVLTVGSLAFGTLVWGLADASAQTIPSLTVRYEVTNLNGDGGVWKKSTTAKPGDTLQLYVELHNVNVGTTALNPKVRSSFTTGTFTSGTSTTVFWADNASQTSDQIQLTLNPASSLEYVAGSTKLTWDVNGDGVREYDGTPIADGIAQGGISLPGHMNGCNQFIAQISFRVRVVGQVQPSPTPTPTPAPSPSPSPAPAGNVNNNTNTNQNTNNININNTQNQTQTVTVAAAAPAAQAAAAPAKQPVTGPSVLGMVAMAGGLPLGLALARFGRGRAVVGKKDEDLATIAFSLTRNRLDRKGRA